MDKKNDNNTRTWPRPQRFVSALGHAVCIAWRTLPSFCAEMSEDAPKGMLQCRFQAESGRIRGKCDQQSAADV